MYECADPLAVTLSPGGEWSFPLVVTPAGVGVTTFDVSAAAVEVGVGTPTYPIHHAARATLRGVEQLFQVVAVGAQPPAVEVGAPAQLYATVANVAGVFRQVDAAARVYSPDGALVPAARAMPLHTVTLPAGAI